MHAVICPLTTNGFRWLAGKLAVLNNKWIVVIAVEFLEGAFVTRGQKIGLLVGETMELKFGDRRLDFWDEQDAKWQIEMLGNNLIQNDELVHSVHNSIKENLALALVDSSPYVRYLAKYFIEEENGRQKNHL